MHCFVINAHIVIDSYSSLLVTSGIYMGVMVPALAISSRKVETTGNKNRKITINWLLQCGGISISHMEWYSGNSQKRESFLQGNN